MSEQIHLVIKLSVHVIDLRTLGYLQHFQPLSTQESLVSLPASLLAVPGFHQFVRPL